MTELTQGEKLLRTMAKKYGSIEAWKAHQAKVGAKGGKKTGESKRRGDKAYYQALGVTGAKKRYGKDTNL